jgi:miniconductance mechanosensitive channel
MAHIPTYALISESFTNWRSMETGGMRRFVRYLPFSSASVFFCTRSDLLRYAEVDLLKPELRPWLEAVPETEGAQPEPAAFLNHPRLTNLRVFCLYAEAYLRAHPQIDKRGMLSVSQQAPNERGLPVKLLAFSTRIGYVDHEAVQTEVFDHLVVAARMFDLELYEAPAWHATEPLPLGRSDARHGHLSEGANGRLGPPPPED